MTAESNSDPLGVLRERAEAQVDASVLEVPNMTPEEIEKLIHEFRTHQIELEMQIDELRRTQCELLQSRDRYADLYDFAPVGYLTIDAAGTVLEANLTLAELLGTERQTLGDTAFSTFISPDDQDTFYKHRMLASESGQPQMCELKLLRSDGTVFDAHLKSIKVARQAETGCCFRIAVTDISERRQAELQRETLIAELEAKNTELERFTYTVSHDLKSPLITIQGYTGLLRQDITAANSDAIEIDMSRISSAAESMEQLLGGLLELSRAGRVSSPPTEVSLSTVTRECAELVAGQIAEREVQIDISPTLPSVSADPLRLRQVVQNLIENAVKYMGAQPKPHVVIDSRKEAAETVVFVSDNGVGIDPRYHERIFDMFEQLDPSSPGVGIGLSLVKRIIESLGGRVWVESEGTGQGATFCFTLPGVGTPAGTECCS